jgi:hypothetical protein
MAVRHKLTTPAQFFTCGRDPSGDHRRSFNDRQPDKGTHCRANQSRMPTFKMQRSKHRANQNDA